MAVRTATPPNPEVDWKNLAFGMRKVNGHVSVKWTAEAGWGKPEFVAEPFITMHVAATGLQYGQQAFEGIKAFRTAKGSVHIFRPQENALRINLSSRTASMPEIPEELFLHCLRWAVAGNIDFVPPYAPNGSAGALYIRPLIIGTGPNLMLDSPSEFTFLVWVTPVGSLYGSGGKIPAIDGVVIDTFDRSAPFGTGHSKLGGNYAPVFGPAKAAKKAGYAITLHLDSQTRSYIDEFSTSNALAIQLPSDGSEKDIKLVVPESSTCLRSVTKISVCEIAEKICGWQVEQRPVKFDELKSGAFQELFAAGTAAAITPVRSISYNSHTPTVTASGTNKSGPKFEHPPENKVVRITFGDGETAGKHSQRLFQELTSYQCGDQEDRFGWLWPAEGIVAEDAQ